MGLLGRIHLKCQVIIIPEYPHELTGHADGLIRFIDDDTVFINETYAEPEKEWLRNFLGILTSDFQYLYLIISK